MSEEMGPAGPQMRKLGSIAVQVHRQSLLERWARAGIRRQSAEAQSPLVQWKYLQAHAKNVGRRDVTQQWQVMNLCRSGRENRKQGRRAGSRAGEQQHGRTSVSGFPCRDVLQDAVMKC